jgi:hypothetical protein
MSLRKRAWLGDGHTAGRPEVKATVTASLAALFLLMAASLVPALAGAQSSTTLLPGGNAWGTEIKGEDTVEAGRTAFTALGCGGTHSSNNVAAVDATALRTGAVETRVDALDISGDIGSRSITVIENVDLLDGMITADFVKAVSTTSHGSSGFTSSGDGSTFANLEIDGVSYSPDASGRVRLPGVGHVLLNHQVERDEGAEHVTRMLVVRVTRDVPRFDLPAGTVIIVGHARSALREVGGILRGLAFGSAATASGEPLDADAGPSALVAMPCGGTNGEVRRNQIADVDVPSTFSLFNVRSTARGEVDATTATVRLSNTIEEADVVDGLVHAKAVRAVAAGSAENGIRRFSSGRSGFAELSVQGFDGIDASVEPNTRLDVPGVGVLWLHRVIERDDRIEVRMIELQVTEPNAHGLPIGANIQVGVARAAIR